MFFEKFKKAFRKIRSEMNEIHSNNTKWNNYFLQRMTKLEAENKLLKQRIDYLENK